MKMNKKFLSIAAIAVVFTFAACDNKGEQKDGKENNTNQTEAEGGAEEPKLEAAPELTLNASLDLSAHEMPFTMNVPEGAEFVQGDYATNVRLGESFNIEITDYGTTVEERKAEVEENDINKHKSYIADEENGFITENEVMGQIEYHFFYVLKVDDETQYEFENVKGRSFSKEEAMLMYQAAKSAQLK